MERNLRISVIVPVYNVEQYLRQCLDSILHQTYTDLEIVLVDDGSTDSSGAICDEYAARDIRVKVMHKVNGGLSSARNAGLDLVSGDYVSFVDSDDYLESSLYEHCVSELNADPSLELIRYNFNYLCGDDQIPCLESEVRKIIGPADIFVEKGKLQPMVWTSLYRRDLLCRLGLRFYEGLIHEDDLFTSELYARHLSIKALFIPIIGYYYRVGLSNSIMGKKIAKNSLSSLCIGFASLLQKLQYSDPQAAKYINGYALEFVEGKYVAAVSDGESQEELLDILAPFLSISRKCSLLSYSLEFSFLARLFQWSPKFFIFFGKFYQPIARRLGSKKYG